MAECNNCGCKIDGESMSNWKAKCKDCSSLYCDDCFKEEAEEKGEWFMLECDCGEKIWRKDNG